MTDTSARVASIRARIEAAARRSGRSATQVTLMAVTKTIEPARIREAVESGISVLGENRVQEAEAKAEAVGPGVSWHLIGRQQSNKTRRAARWFDAVHSVDRARLVTRLDAAAAELDRQLDVYVQVEYVRTELPEEQIEDDARRCCALAAEAGALRLRGLMTLPPFTPDPEDARPYFRRLAELGARIAAQEGVSLPGLSMGMSGDFEVAIEEGATIVRVGTALFGSRQ